MTPPRTPDCNSDAMASFNAPFCSQTFLHNAEHEFRWLLRKLGCDKWDADLRAFQMTALLAAEVRRLEQMWQSANAELSDRASKTNNDRTAT